MRVKMSELCVFVFKNFVKKTCSHRCAVGSARVTALARCQDDEIVFLHYFVFFFVGFAGNLQISIYFVSSMREAQFIFIQFWFGLGVWFLLRSKTNNTK